jgi:hypothetical protein
VLLRSLARRRGHAELYRVGLVDLEEGADAHGREGGPKAASPEGGLIVPVEDAEQRLEIEGQRRHPGQLRAVFDQPFRPEEACEHIGPVGLREIVLVDLIEHPEAIEHAAHLDLGVPRQREQGQMRLGDVHADLMASVFGLLAELEAHHPARIGVDLAEETQLDRPRKEAVLLAGERTAAGLLHVPLSERADEVPGETDVEEELAGPAPLREGERLMRPRVVRETRRGRRWRRRLGEVAGWRARRGDGGRWGRRGGRAGLGRRRRGGRRGPRLDGEEPLGHALQLLAQLLHLAAERLHVFREGGSGAEQEDNDEAGDEDGAHGHSSDLVRGPDASRVTLT